MNRKKNINILFLGGSKRVSVAESFINSGTRNEKNVKIFSYELDTNEPIGQIGTIILGLKWSNALIFEHLENIIVKYNISIVVPFVDIATIICSELQKKLKNIFFCISDENMNKIMMDKRLADKWFIENKFRVPASNNKPPLVAKPNKGSGGKGMFF